MSKPIHNGRTTANGKARLRPVPKVGDRAGNAEIVAVDEPPEPPHMHTPDERLGPRPCDLNKCIGAGAAALEINVSPYTGNPDDRLTLVVCGGHAAQYRDGAIVGFAWTPVYKTDAGVKRPIRDAPQA